MPDDLPYRIDGDFVELCDCTTVCPCWLDLPPTENRCTGAFAWAIDTGEIDGIDVSGRRVVSVSFHSGHRDTGGQEVFLFVDEKATDEQYQKLTVTFSGKAGGPLGELSRLMGVLRGTERAAIEVSSTGKFVSLTVDQRISGDAKVLTGADGEVTQLSHGRLSTVLGPTADVGTSSSFRVDLGNLGFGFGIEVRARAAMRGKFGYRNEGTPG